MRMMMKRIHPQRYFLHNLDMVVDTDTVYALDVVQNHSVDEEVLLLGNQCEEDILETK